MYLLIQIKWLLLFVCFFKGNSHHIFRMVDRHNTIFNPSVLLDCENGHLHPIRSFIIDEWNTLWRCLQVDTIYQLFHLYRGVCDVFSIEVVIVYILPPPSKKNFLVVTCKRMFNFLNLKIYQVSNMCSHKNEFVMNNYNFPETSDILSVYWVIGLPLIISIYYV